MSDKQIGEYPLNIKIVSGSYEIANIDINVPPPTLTRTNGSNTSTTAV